MSDLLCYCCNPTLQVALCCSVPAHWLLLKSRLEKICPRSQGAQALWRWNSRGSEPLQHPFLLQVTSYNREGVLHGVCLAQPTGGSTSYYFAHHFFLATHHCIMLHLGAYFIVFTVCFC